MDIVPFLPEHLRRLRLQPAQAWCGKHLTDDLLRESASLEAYTAVVEGEPVACAGLMPFWEGRVMAWSYLGANAGSYLFGITKAAREFLDECGERRVEAYVDPEFKAAHRWMGLLGFQPEGLLQAFMPDGRDQVLYSRVNHG